jgi:hypothetical protein
MCIFSNYNRNIFGYIYWILTNRKISNHGSNFLFEKNKFYRLVKIPKDLFSTLVQTLQLIDIEMKILIDTEFVNCLAPA